MSTDVHKQPSGVAVPLWYMFVCGVMLSLPVIVWLVAVAWLTFFDSTPLFSISDPVFWVLVTPGLALLFAEYQVIFRRSVTFAFIIAIVCFWALACGSFSVITGFLGLVGIGPLDSDFPNWWEFIFYLCSLMYLAAIGCGHWKWHRQLRAIGNR